VSADLEKLGEGLKGIMKGLVKDAGADLRNAEVQAYVEAMSNDLVQYTTLAVSGSPRAAQNLRHLKAQGALLAGIIKGRLAAKAREAFQNGLALVAKTAVAALAAV